MKLRFFPIFVFTAVALLTGALLVSGQGRIEGVITGGETPKIAIIDFRGSGEAQQFMNVFNETLWNDVAASGALEMVAKTLYPLDVPQQPSDFRPPVVTNVLRDAGEEAQVVRPGPWLTDWSGPPVNTNYLAFGFTAAQGDTLVLRGWLYNVGQSDIQSAQVFGNSYFGSLDEAGSIKVAHEFAADILEQMGVKSLSGTKIYFVSDRSGSQEIWSMEYDGSDQRQLTSYGTISKMPAVSPDGREVALVTLAKTDVGDQWQIRRHSTETGRRLTFVNYPSSLLATPEYSPDGKKLYYSVSLNDWQQLAVSNVDGSDLQRISHVEAIEVSPRVNPRTGRELLFISGRSGKQQLWKGNVDGGGLERLTDGTGEVANPVWSPNGQHIAFAWTKGFAPGAFNIFVMDIASREIVQLTHDSGGNENPAIAPDGLHVVYSSKRGRVTQLYSSLINGTQVRQLTSQGNNLQPVWANAIE